MSEAAAITTTKWRTLTEDEGRWVQQTLARLDTSARIGQLFNFGVNDSDTDVSAICRTRAGGFHRFPGADLARARDISRRLFEQSEVPPLVSADIEGGETGFGFGTPLLNQLGMAACDDPDLTQKLAEIAACEARAVGCNWSFAPVVDINAAFRSTVVGTRSFGSDPGRILAHARAHVAGTQGAGLAATAKHWPGEGFDDRDQHLVTTINPMTMQDWRGTFGRIFQQLIDDGVMAIMAGHIALPAYHRECGATPGRGAVMPASLSRLLNIDLLRGELGFQGLIVSDATVMGGLTSWTNRATAVPGVIEGGCDMFLFSRDPQGDMALMEAGLSNGSLSEDRLEAAVTRILTLKALLGLHRTTADSQTTMMEDASTRLKSSRSTELARATAAASLTLVKDTVGLLPLDRDKHRRIVLAVETHDQVFIDGAMPRSFNSLTQALRRHGFDVRAYDGDAPPTPEDTDLLIYAVGRESTPVIGSSRIDWAALHGSPRRGMLRHRDVHTVMIAFGHPYLLYDAPWVPTFINAYSAIEPVQLALVDALTGAAPLAGSSPIDPFCGREDLGW